jgi:streptogramin lyase
MVIPSVIIRKIPLKTTANCHLLHLTYGMIILLWLTICGEAFATDGLIREIALPDDLSSAHSMAIDSTGRVWFSEKVGKTLAVFDPEKKEFATYSLPPTWGKVGFSKITMSPDGDIWFTVNRWAEGDGEPHLLGRFTPADGYFTRYVLSIDSIPEELLVDAKGVIWFFASNKNSLYRVDPVTFALKGYPVPTANGYPRSLAVDHNGHIWFVESNANKIGKFDPDQAVFHEYEVPTAFANPEGIAIDKDGKVWFAEVATNRLGVFYPDLRRFDEALIPTPNSSPTALVSDDQGNIWFLEYRGNKVGVFKPLPSRFYEFDIPNFSSLPGELAIDKKRSLLWFTQGSTEAKRLGMLSIKATLAEIDKQDNDSRDTSSDQALPLRETASSDSVLKWLVVLLVLLAIVMIIGLRYFNSKRQGL